MVAAARILCFSALCVASAALALPTNDDPTNQIRFSTQAEADAHRQALVDFIWEGPLPATLPVVTEDVPVPILLNGFPVTFDVDPSLYSRVDTVVAWVTSFDYFMNTLLVHPSTTTEHTQRLVIVHQGHAAESSSLAAGIRETAEALLAEGYTVAIHQLPISGWNAVPFGDDVADVPGYGIETYQTHSNIIANTGPLFGGWGFRIFLEPIVQTVNHWTQQPGAGDVSITGVSGGGWAAHMAAAVDPRIRQSIPVAGAAPLYRKNEHAGAIGDLEQYFIPHFDEDIAPDGSGGGVATWLEVFALGGYGPGRRQVMVTNLTECCFGGTYPDTFKHIVSAKVKELGPGYWEHTYDLTVGHALHPWTIENVLLEVLDPPPVPALPAWTPWLLGVCLLAAGARSTERAERARRAQRRDLLVAEAEL